MENMREIPPSPIAASSSPRPFWLRILAIILDYIILSVLGKALGFLLEEQFARMGPWGLALGFAIVFLYFCILNSAVSKGQTLGKAITRTCVVNPEGEPISLPISALRTLILILPFLSINMASGYSFWRNPIGIGIYGVLFFTTLGIVFFYIFNRHSRQSIHDLVCKTYVVRAEETGPVRTVKNSYLSYIVFSGMVILYWIIGYAISPSLLEPPEIKKRFNETEGVLLASTSADRVTVLRSGKQKIVARLRFNPGRERPLFEATANEVTRGILESYAGIEEIETIEVGLLWCKYDIIIANVREHYTEEKSRVGWLRKLGLPNPTAHDKAPPQQNEEK